MVKKVRVGVWMLTCPDCDESREVSNMTKYVALKSGDTRCRSCAMKKVRDPRRHNSETLLLIEPDPNNRQRYVVECPACHQQRNVHRCQVSYYVKNGHSRCRSCAIKGKRHWRFDEFAKRKRVYRRAEWDRVRRIIRRRDKVCQYPYCKRLRSPDGRALSVHHIEPLKKTNEHDLANLIALCSVHHTWADQHLSESIPLFRNILSSC